MYPHYTIHTPLHIHYTHIHRRHPLLPPLQEARLIHPPLHRAAVPANGKGVRRRFELPAL